MGFAQSFSTPPPSLNEAVEGLRIALYAQTGRKGLRPLPTLLRNAGRAGSSLPAALPVAYPNPIFITNK